MHAKRRIEKMRKKRNYASILMILFVMLLNLPSQLLTIKLASAQLELPPGVEREEVLIYDPMGGRSTNPSMHNWYASGGDGLHSFMFDHLWDINSTTGEFINSLASAPPEELSPYDLTRWRFHLREGMYWTDGVEFTAEDVVFTINLVKNTEGLVSHEFFRDLIKEAKVEDKYSVDLELKRPYAKLQEGYFGFGVVEWGCIFTPLPKHIWEDVEDTVTFQNEYPVVTGAYILKDYDSNGYWFLLKRREDWWRSPVGQILGMPKPKYILSIYYGPEEKKIMAMIRHELDICCDITPEALFTLKEQNPYARAWYSYYPYGWFDDTCERGISFNLLNFPYNITQVRWALTLAVNITEASIAMYNGMLRMSPLHIPPTKVLMEHYFWPSLPWLREFELPFDPGYKPFDPEPPVKIAQYVKEMYPDEPIPTDEREVRELFGMGWWKYDPAEAEKLLKSVGFTRDANGNWLLPTGEKWSMTIVAPGAYEYESNRVAFVIADQFRTFGIDVNVQALEPGAFWSYEPTGEYDAGTYWPGCASVVDLYSNVQDRQSKYIVPTGESAPGNNIRWNNSKVDEIARELETIPPTDYERLKPLGMEYLKVAVIDMPYIPMFGTTKIVPSDTYYWGNMPTADNLYAFPTWWWSNFKFILPSLTSKFIQLKYVDVWMIRDTPKFKGVDNKYYGPSEVGDHVTVPEEDSMRLLAEGFASLEAPPPSETTVTVTVTETTTETTTTSVPVPTMDVTSVAGAGIVALIAGIVVGWLLGSRKRAK